MIPNNIIEDIRYRNDIEDVISSYITLKKAGSNLKGLCPFHSERTPSFVVYRDTQSYYCFGCGAGGDVINFVMRQENLDYVAAVEFLAKRAGIALLDFEYERAENSVSRSRILKMNIEAAKFFRNMLFDDRIGAAARTYLINERRLGSSIVKRFGIGFAPNNPRALSTHLLDLGFTYKEMTAGYLCGKSDRGYYDYFRGRVIFPIIDVSGNIVAFGGRVLDSSVPKYLNTSDTPAFKKSKNLFALNFAKNFSEDTLIVCEGYMDVIAMHAAGFQNAVATLGTAITPEHARIIKRYASKAILSYDNDEAGQKAADRAVKLLGEAGVDTKILVMNGAKDPDEYIKKYGAEAFKRLLNDSRSRFDYFIENIKKKYNLENDDEKIKAASEVCRFISNVYSRVEREIYIDKTAAALGVEKKSIELDVINLIKRKNRDAKKKSTGELIRLTSGLSDRTNPDFAKTPKIGRLEEDILGMIMTYPELLKNEPDGKALCEADFYTDLGKRLFTFICNAEKDNSFNIGLLSSEFTMDEVSRAVKMQTARRDLTNDKDTFVTYVLSLRHEISKFMQNDSCSLEDIISRKRSK